MNIKYSDADDLKTLSSIWRLVHIFWCFIISQISISFRYFYELIFGIFLINIAKTIKNIYCLNLNKNTALVVVTSFSQYYYCGYFDLILAGRLYFLPSSCRQTKLTLLRQFVIHLRSIHINHFLQGYIIGTGVIAQFEGILPCVSMAGKVLLAGYPRIMNVTDMVTDLRNTIKQNSFKGVHLLWVILYQ